MVQPLKKSCTAFAGGRRVASGTLLEVALEAKRLLDGGSKERFLLFDDASSEQLDLDWSLTVDELRRQVAALADPALQESDEPRGVGRPRLGVVAREVTLLPRHWEWLNEQPGGASVALRRLVEQARKTGQGKDRARRSQESAYRFMSALAGDEAGFEEATRALFAGERRRFEQEMKTWPADVRAHARQLAAGAFEK